MKSKDVWGDKYGIGWYQYSTGIITWRQYQQWIAENIGTPDYDDMDEYEPPF